MDCDDTLVRWLDAVEGRLVTDWEPNEKVVAFVKQWQAEHPEGLIIVWSSGGKDYARMWGDRILPDVPFDYSSKWPVIPGPTDLFIDDMPFDVWKSHSIHPASL